MQTSEDRFIDIEMAIAEQQKMLDELNQVVIDQGKTIAALVKQNQYLLNMVEHSSLKPQSEETPPPHY